MSRNILNTCLLLSVAVCSYSALKAQVKPTPPKQADVSKLATGGQKLDLHKNNNQKGTLAKGVVLDAATQKPLAAVNVTIDGFSAALTDDNGKFSIRVPNYNATLVISGEGFQTKELPLRGKKEVKAILYEASYNSIYDVANLPFGAKSKNHISNAVSSVNTLDNWTRSTESVDGLVQGKVAGLNATMRSGTPNAGAYLSLRGVNSLYTNNQPLIVVDGMIYDINDYGSSLIANRYNNALANIDIRDIENITVIKDGSATYGTKGANGVLLITTAHTNQLATRIDAGIYAGVNFAPQQLPLMNGGNYRTYLTDLLATRGWSNEKIMQQPYMNDDTANNPEYYRYHNATNWQNEVLGNAITNNYYVKVSGGDNIAKYVLSMGYARNGGITKETDLTKYNIRLNADLNLSNRLTATTNLTFNYFEQNLKDQGFAFKTNPLLVAYAKAPFVSRNDIDNVGAVSPNLADVDTLGIGNPTALINNMIGSSKTYRFFGSLAFKYKLFKNINVGSLIGVTVDQVREQYFVPRKGVTNDTTANAIYDSRLGGLAKRIFTIYNDTYIDYLQTFNTNKVLNVRAGLRYLNSKNEQDIAQGFNSTTDDFITVGTGSNTLRRVSGDIGKYGWINTYLNAEYSIDKKYFFNASLTVDGSSRFGSNVANALKLGGNSFAVLPSVSAAWLISSEKFMSKFVWLDVLKLRATYSKTGNDDIGNYTQLQSYVSQNLLGLQGLVRANIGNNALQWESNNKFNIGLDAAFFNERVSVSVDVFSNRTKNMLVYAPLPVASGYDFAITNGGSLKNSGIELQVNTRIINNKNTKWDVGFNIATSKNTITNLPDNVPVITNYGGASFITNIGGIANRFFGLKTNGVYSTDAEAAADGLTRLQTDGTYASYKGGDMKFIDLNGDKIIDDRDRQNIGKATPDYFGGITTSFTYKRITLEAVFNYTVGNDVYNGLRAVLESQSNVGNQLSSVINRWRVNGQVTNMPKSTWGDPMGNAQFSDRWIEDGSFFRMKMLSLNYQLPIKSTKALRYVNLYVTGNNLLTFTKYLGYDPEFYAAESVFARGVDASLEPISKSVTLGVRIGL